MRCLIIKDISPYLPAGIIADFTRKYVEQLYAEGKIADPAIKADTHLRRWKAGYFDDVQEGIAEVSGDIKTTPEATEPLNVAKKQSTGFFTKKHK